MYNKTNLGLEKKNIKGHNCTKIQRLGSSSLTVFSFQHWATIGWSAKRHSNSVWLEGRYGGALLNVYRVRTLPAALALRFVLVFVVRIHLVS